MSKSKISISYSPYFIKKFQKLPPSLQQSAIQREQMFRENMHAPMLKTHKLTGKLARYCAFSVNYHYRILFIVESNSEIVFVNIGTHAIYR